MKNYKSVFKSLLIIVVSVFISISTIVAQQSINSVGNEATGSGGSTNYSIGQVAYQNHTSAFGSVSEGVQQPYEIMELSGVEEFMNIKINASAYPNPTKDILSLDIADNNLDNFSFRLFDNNGRLLQNERINNNKTEINMNPLPSATYYVKIYSNDNQVKTFKIIKQ